MAKVDLQQLKKLAPTSAQQSNFSKVPNVKRVTTSAPTMTKSVKTKAAKLYTKR